MRKYVAVGFKVNKDRSIFYFKTDSITDFMEKLNRQILKTEPDFVSLWVVKNG